MSKTPLMTGLVAAFGVLSSCQTAPGPSANPALAACPAFATGQGPIEAPFPDTCAQMRSAPSGLKWIELAKGDALRGTPGPDATVVVSYEGFLAESGQLIDSSYQRGEPSVFEIGELLPGWGEAMQKMSPGDEWLIFVPWPIAYGAAPVRDIIPAEADILYRVRLDGFLTPEQIAADASKSQGTSASDEGPDARAWANLLPFDASAAGWNRLDSGVSYIRLKRGNTISRNALRTDDVLIHYDGRLASDGTSFDSSWSRGEPTRFPVSGLIPGFAEVLTYMKLGDRVIVHIPSDKAYGESGSGEIIGPNADLMFEISMLEIFPAE
ncbi:MAG: FKBP-type peptidyl-prolyl cis-trans isomerase [Pseudomonadota bacterium]